jgi:predicted RNase H-like nuclease (RuvC/YqgF family)
MTLFPTLRAENASLITKVEKLNACDDSITNFRNENASLIAKIDKLNESISSLRTENDSLISKACVWVPKVLVSNIKGPKTVWVPKNKV